MDAIYLSDKHGEQVSWRAWQGIIRSTNWLTENWQRPDEAAVAGTSDRMRERVDRYFDYQQDCWIDLYAKRQRR
jgi:hypothetical protein